MMLSLIGVAGPSPSPEEVMNRLSAYLVAYEARLSSTVAVEHYEQQLGSGDIPRRRVLESDFLFMRLPGGGAWLGYRDIFRVDGRPIRSRNSTLLERLAAGDDDGVVKAALLADANAKYNLGDIPRSINVPTEALGLLNPGYRSRFTVRKAGEDKIDGRRYWKIEARETARP